MVELLDELGIAGFDDTALDAINRAVLVGPGLDAVRGSRGSNAGSSLRRYPTVTFRSWWASQSMAICRGTFIARTNEHGTHRAADAPTDPDADTTAIDFEDLADQLKT